jgi:3-hydroxyisobutyrate dehydrogenase-like beta-hydroxyacid dehydrogenase
MLRPIEAREGADMTGETEAIRRDRLGCVGLGELGLAIAGNLIASGFHVTGYRRSALDAFAALGGRKAGSAAEVMAQSDIVLTCLPSGDALREVVGGPEGLAVASRAGQIVIDCSTASLTIKQELAASHAACGITLLDCPISGRPDAVRARQAQIYVSGENAAAERCRPVFDAISERHLYLGPFGAGSRMKYITNLLLAVQVMAIAEAVEIGARSGFSPELVERALTGSAVDSRQLHIRAPTIASGRSLPGAPGSFHEDLLVIRDYVRALGCASPLFDTALNHFEQAETAGHGGRDSVLMFTAILRALAASRPDSA